MNNYERFLFGFLGSLAIEVLNVYKIKRNDNPIPSHYKNFPFLFFRLVLAAIGGVFAIAYGIDKRLLAFHIGATLPLIINGMEEKPPTI